MAIPESQLETWSNQGATTSSSRTYGSIKAALGGDASPLRTKDFDVYLQGSYRNSTNIRGDSDVDVVVQLNSTFHSDKSRLSIEEKRLYESTFSRASYQWADFRADVLAALRAYYGPAAVTEGNKSVKIAGDSGRLPTDVVPCLQYRRYFSFKGASSPFTEGIVFWATRDSHRIINFPKLHFQNGADKNSAAETSGWYKPSVRMLKNARTWLVDHGYIGGGLAPSYFLECLLYNVPDANYGVNYRDTYAGVVNYLDQAILTSFMCQNKQMSLFGDSKEQWNTRDAMALHSHLVKLWKEWSS